MTDLTTNEDFIQHVIEVDNSLVTEENIYCLNMPQAVGLNFRYADVCFDIKLSDDFTGNVNVFFYSVFNDSGENEHMLQANLSMLSDKSITTAQLNESNNEQTWKLLDTTISKLKFKINQVSPGQGKFFLILRASI